MEERKITHVEDLDKAKLEFIHSHLSKNATNGEKIIISKVHEFDKECGERAYDADITLESMNDIRPGKRGFRINKPIFSSSPDLMPEIFMYSEANVRTPYSKKEVNLLEYAVASLERKYLLESSLNLQDNVRQADSPGQKGLPAIHLDTKQREQQAMETMFAPKIACQTPSSKLRQKHKI